MHFDQPGNDCPGRCVDELAGPARLMRFYFHDPVVVYDDIHILLISVRAAVEQFPGMDHVLAGGLF
ncbi:hypothetical protein D3C87_2064160 [compost metagenome]